MNRRNYWLDNKMSLDKFIFVNKGMLGFVFEVPCLYAPTKIDPITYDPIPLNTRFIITTKLNKVAVVWSPKHEHASAVVRFAENHIRQLILKALGNLVLQKERNN